MNRQVFFCSLGGFDTHAGELERTTRSIRNEQAMARSMRPPELGVAQK